MPHDLRLLALVGPSSLALDDYQSQCRRTAVYSSTPIIPIKIPSGSKPPPGTEYLTEYPALYPFLGLCGESGEIADKVKKILRGDHIEAVGHPAAADSRLRADLGMELGDLLWYVAECASTLGYSLSEIAQANLEKLKDRMARGVTRGSGDAR